MNIKHKHHTADRDKIVGHESRRRPQIYCSSRGHSALIFPYQLSISAEESSPCSPNEERAGERSRFRASSARSMLPHRPVPSLDVSSHRCKPVALSTLNRGFGRKKLRAATQPFRRPEGRTAAAQLFPSENSKHETENASKWFPLSLVKPS
jgi:hypothetical protein